MERVQDGSIFSKSSKYSFNILRLILSTSAILLVWIYFTMACGIPPIRKYSLSSFIRVRFNESSKCGLTTKFKFAYAEKGSSDTPATVSAAGRMPKTFSRMYISICWNLQIEGLIRKICKSVYSVKSTDFC